MIKGTENKLKFQRLQKRLRLERWQCKGLLESIWDFTEENCPRGDIGRFTNEEIALGIDYGGDPDELIAALTVKDGWIDSIDDPEVRLYIHDWHEHAQYTVHNKLARGRLFFANGAAPKLTRLSKDERAELIRFYENPQPPGGGCGKTDDGERTASARRAHETEEDFDGERTASAQKAEMSARRAHRKRTESGNERTASAHGAHAVRPNRTVPYRTVPENPPLSPQGGKGSEAAIPEGLDTAEFRAVWAEWTQERRLNAKTQERQLAMMAEWGAEQAMEALHRSLTNGWRAIAKPNGAGAANSARNGAAGPGTRAGAAVIDPYEDEWVPTEGAKAKAGEWGRVKSALKGVIPPGDYERFVEQLVCRGVDLERMILHLDSGEIFSGVSFAAQDAIAEAILDAATEALGVEGMLKIRWTRESNVGVG